MGFFKKGFVGGGLRKWLTACAWVYFTGLFGWLAAYLLTGDRFGFMGVINSLAVHLFIPLPVVLLTAIFIRQRSVWIGVLVGIMAFLGLWGQTFIPQAQPVKAGSDTLTVLTYNVLGLHTEVVPSIEVITEENADVVLLQEVNTWMAGAFETDLQDLYPYQYHLPQDGVRGMGILSKYPFTRSVDSLPLDWVGPPQVVVMDWQGQAVTLVNFHMWAVLIEPEAVMAHRFRQREAQAQALADLAARTDSPLIIAGDANATPLSWTYKIIRSAGLKDVWEEAGWGLGHTFPGSERPGSSRPHIAGIPVPTWLVRIDFIFVSSDWVVHQAELASFDGVSDHRGVRVELSLAP